MNAQGEDVVAGVRTPQSIEQLAEVMPEAYAQFVDICHKLEYHYRDMQDMEFTIENKKLYMLQTRNGKRTAAAAMKIACDLVDEGMITEEEAVAMIDPKSLDALLHPTFDAAALKKAKVIGTGLAASPARPAARSCSPLRRPPTGARAAIRSSSSVSRPAPRTSRACTTHRAS